MGCPWHGFGVEHPVGSPKCEAEYLVRGSTEPETHVVRVKDLVAWAVMVVNDLVTIQIETMKAVESLTTSVEQLMEAQHGGE